MARVDAFEILMRNRQAGQQSISMQSPSQDGYSGFDGI